MTQASPLFITPSGQVVATTDLIGVHQIAVYVMCGGGLLELWAAENPADFCMDDCVHRLPYGRDEIRRSVELLARIARAHGFDSHELPCMPLLHSFAILREV